tara:strand:- start:448 stop:3345 length:2898 start_codon:yes stop_codon:yes gene_type:complete
MAGRQLQAQQRLAEARAAADVLEVPAIGAGRRGIKAQPKIEAQPEESIWNRFTDFVNKPYTKSGVIEDTWSSPPTTYSQAFLDRAAYGSDAMREADRFIEMSNTPTTPWGSPVSIESQTPDFLSAPDMGMPNRIVDMPPDDWSRWRTWPPMGVESIESPPYRSPHGREGVDFFTSEQGEPLYAVGTYNLGDTTKKNLGGEPGYGDTALLTYGAAQSYERLQEAFQRKFNKPFKIESAFRDHDHNAAVKGSSETSKHMEGNSIDIKFSELNSTQVKWLKDNAYKYGLGYHKYSKDKQGTETESQHFDFVPSEIRDRLEDGQFGDAVKSMEVPRFLDAYPHVLPEVEEEPIGLIEAGTSSIPISTVEDQLALADQWPPIDVPEASLSEVVGELPLGQQDYLGSERQIDSTAHWRKMAADKELRESIEGTTFPGQGTMFPRTEDPTALQAEEFADVSPIPTNEQINAQMISRLQDQGIYEARVSPSDIDPAAAVGEIAADEVPSDLIPDFYGNRFHVPSMVQDLQAEVSTQGDAPFYRDEIAGAPNWSDMISLPDSPTDEAVAAVSAKNIREAEERLAQELELAGAPEAAEAVLQSQKTEEAEMKKLFYFPEDVETDPDMAKLAEEIGGIQGVGLPERIGDWIESAKDAVSPVIEDVLAKGASAADATGEWLSGITGPYVEDIMRDQGQYIDPSEVIGETDIPDVPMGTTAEGPTTLDQPAVEGPIPLDPPTVTTTDSADLASPQVLTPPTIETADNIQDYAAALYGEPPGVPQFPVVPQPGTPELTKMGFFAKNYKQSDLVNPPSEMIRNAFPWAANLPTEVLERAARNPDFFRELMDKYGRPEGSMSWSNPDLAATDPVVEPSPQMVGGQATAELERAPVEAMVADTPAQDAQVQSDARASLNELIGQLSWVQRMAIQGYGIDLDKFSSFFTKNDIAELYQFMLQNKDRVGPEIWSQIEAINNVLG